MGNNYRERIFGLDIFRSFAITLVVMGHGSFLLSDTVLHEFPYFRMIDGVDLFFVLSGFLIGGILLQEINSKDEFRFRDLTGFWKNRWLRTLPNYYLILLVNYIFVSHRIILEDIQQFNWRFVLFLQNFSSPFYGFFWESWSLSIEEWFYILSPLLLILFVNFLTPKKSFILVTGLMIVFPSLYRIIIFNPTLDGFWLDVSIRKVVVTRLDAIAYGLLASWLFYYFEGYWKKYKIVSLLVGVGLIIFVVNYKLPSHTFYRQVIFYSISPISAMMLLPFAQSIKTGKGVLANAVTHVSKISYSMYLINLALVAEVIRDNFPPTSGIDGFFKYLLYWAIVLIGSTILYRYFEKPIMNLRQPKAKLASHPLLGEGQTKINS